MGMWIGRNRLLGPVAGSQGLRAEKEALAVLASVSCHFSIPKACNLLGLGEGSYVACGREDCVARGSPWGLDRHVFSPAGLHYVNLDSRGRMDVADLERNVARLEHAGVRRFIIVAVAGATLTGAVDPVPDIARVMERGKERGLDFHLHVDAAFGGLVAPFMESGAPPPFDFRVPGVSSLTVDVHKAGLGPFGTGVVLVRKDLFQFVERTAPCHMYLDETFACSRPGTSAAAAWAVLAVHGCEGYRRLVAQCLEGTARLIAHLDRLGVDVIGPPEINIVAAVPRQPRVGRALEAIRSRFMVARRVHYRSSRERGTVVYRFVIMPHVTLEAVDEFAGELEAQLAVEQA